MLGQTEEVMMFSPSIGFLLWQSKSRNISESDTLNKSWTHDKLTDRQWTGDLFKSRRSWSVQTCCCSRVRMSSTSLSSRFSWELISHRGGSSGYFSTYVNLNVASTAARRKQTAHIIRHYYFTFKLSFFEVFTAYTTHTNPVLVITLAFSHYIFWIAVYIIMTNSSCISHQTATRNKVTGIPHTSAYSLSQFSPASDVTVIVKLVGSSDSTANRWRLVSRAAIWKRFILFLCTPIKTPDGREQAACPTSQTYS